MGQIIESIREFQDLIIMEWNSMSIIYRVTLVTFIVSVAVGKYLQWELQDLKIKRNKNREELKKKKVYDNVFFAAGLAMLISMLVLIIGIITSIQDQIIMGWNDMTLSYRYIVATFIGCIVAGKYLKCKLQYLKIRQNKSHEDMKKFKVCDNVSLAVGTIWLITALLIFIFPALDLAFKN